MFLDAMPLNPTGKVDRAALKKLAAGDHAAAFDSRSGRRLQQIVEDGGA